MGIVNIGPVYAGDDLTFSFVVEKPDGTPQDLTNASVRWGYALRSAPTVPIATKTIGAGLGVPDPTSGLVVVYILGGQIPIGRYIHELEVTLTTGDTYTHAHGALAIRSALYPNPYPG